MKRLLAIAGLCAVLGGTSAQANPAILGIAVIAGEVLSPIGSALGIVKDVPDVWTELQRFVDPRALELPPQPVPKP